MSAGTGYCFYVPGAGMAWAGRVWSIFSVGWRLFVRSRLSFQLQAKSVIFSFGRDESSLKRRLKLCRLPGGDFKQRSSTN